VAVQSNLNNKNIKYIILKNKNKNKNMTSSNPILYYPAPQSLKINKQKTTTIPLFKSSSYHLFLIPSLPVHPHLTPAKSQNIKRQKKKKKMMKK
jgi:hypothetical protein